MILKELRYTDPVDVHMRLTGTVIRYKKRPIYVPGIAGGLSIQVNDLLSGANFDVHSSDEDLDISSPPLGYCNPGGDSTLYVARLPRRKQNQGFHPGYALITHDHTTLQGWKYPMTFLGRTIVGDYPSFDDCLDQLKPTKKNTSFGRSYDRHFSVWQTKDPGLVRIKHLIDDIGLYSKTDKTGFLLPMFKNETRLISKLRKHMEVMPLGDDDAVEGQAS